jgi:fumarate hydratase subunit alpha
MKNIEITKIKKAVNQLIKKASFELPPDIIKAIEDSREVESGSAARHILDLIIENSRTAKKEELPLCQDCGNTYIDLKIGPDICIEDSSSIYSHLNDAVSEAYKKNYLRKSTVGDPLYNRINREDNTPAIFSTSFNDEPGLKITVSLKGGGSENCSYLFMENPTMGESRIMELVRDMVKANVTKCCPPVIIGIGIGSTASEVVKLARKAAFRELDKKNQDKRYAKLEKKILTEVNNTGIGPQGLGGDITAIGCNIEFAPCHIATLPVSLFLQCHSLRRASVVINP